jgi:FkbM family methyltransferase
MSVSKMVQALFRRCGLNLTRLPGNRFDVMPDVLRQLAREGFAPTLIIDVGANRGQWAAMVSAVFARVPLHLIEPQAACRADLDAFAARRGATEIHNTFLTRRGVSRVQVVGGGSGSTGAHVIDTSTGRTDGESMPALTLDAVFAHRLRDADRVLLKLDVEGHELDVLDGASAVLAHVEVIVSEVTFFDIEHTGYPTFTEFVATLARAGFVLYDIAALASRRRDGRLRMGDAVFVRTTSPLMADDSWA